MGPGTLLRFRCNDLLISFDPTEDAADRMVVTLGLGIVSTDAANLGFTAMPDPATEVDYPWIWWGQYVLRSHQAVAHNQLGTSVVRTSVDSKAMRRVKPNQSLVWIAEFTDQAGAPVTLIDIAATRVLIGN